MITGNFHFAYNTLLIAKQIYYSCIFQQSDLPVYNICRDFLQSRSEEQLPDLIPKYRKKSMGPNIPCLIL